MVERTGMGRLVARAMVLVVVLLVLPAPAVAATRMYVSTARSVDGTVAISGYALDGTTQIQDAFQLDLVRAGVTVATAQAPDFVLLSLPSLLPGDEIVLTDTTMAATRTATFTGNPTLTPPACGAAAFNGERDEGATVNVSASMGAETVPTVQRFGPGTTYAGAFASALTEGWIVRASQGREIDAGFTVFDAVEAAVGGGCPVVPPPEEPKPDPPPVTPPAAVVPAAPVAPPSPPAAAPLDTVAPVGRIAVRTKAAAIYKALLAGTFTSSVTVNEAGTVSQKLLAGKATLAKASKSIGRAGTVTLRLTLSKSGRRVLTKARTTKLTLTTSVRDAAGNARMLSPRRLTATRKR